MAYKPILFSTTMVQANLAGRKTQTRRVIKPLPDENGISYMPNAPLDWELLERKEWCPYFYDTDEGERIACHPKYRVGDIMWVRESFRINSWCPDDGDITVRYEADGSISESIYFEDENVFEKYWVQCCKDMEKAGHKLSANEIYTGYDPLDLRLRPNIFMPREAARLFLEVTNVRVERLKDITEEDAISEGVEQDRGGWKSYDVIEKGPHKGKPHPWNYVPFKDAYHSYQSLWQSINGQASWDANPWVWVYQYKQVEKPIDFLK